jgi:hypothetical protein
MPRPVAIIDVMVGNRAWHAMPLQFAVGALLVATILASPRAAAQDASPTPDAPPPELCTVDSRSLEDLNKISAATPSISVPTRTPGTIPKGIPADAETMVGITATVRELVACFNAGELLRAYGLYTDSYLQRLFGRQDPLSASAYSSLATPEPEPVDKRAAILDLRDVRVLDDGSVGATVTIKYAVVPIPKSFFFTFVRRDGRWWIDGILGEISFSVP